MKNQLKKIFNQIKILITPTNEPRVPEKGFIRIFEEERNINNKSYLKKSWWHKIGMTVENNKKINEKQDMDKHFKNILVEKIERESK